MVKAKELVSLEFSILIDARYVAREVTKQGHPRDLYRNTSCMHAHILPGLPESNMIMVSQSTCFNQSSYT
jgi:hypothetical protein